MTRGSLTESIKRIVRQRAGDRCEYCRVPQASQLATYHIDHVVPRSKGGTDAPSNLALACGGCSLHKAAKSDGIDPASGLRRPLFHPRQMSWNVHFALGRDGALVGRTPVGRATIQALHMNRPLAKGIRLDEAARGRWP